MATENKKHSDVSAAIYGKPTPGEKAQTALSNKVANIINTIKIDTGKQTSQDILTYFKEVDIGKFYNNLAKANPSLDKKGEDIKTYMNRIASGFSAEGFEMQSDTLMGYRNYQVIYDTIPQAAQACDLILANILSPDDFTKIILNVKYDSQDDVNNETKEAVEADLKSISERYNTDEVVKKAVKTALIKGKSYVSVLSIDKELTRFINNRGRTTLIENGQISMTLKESQDALSSILTENQNFDNLHKISDSAITLTEDFIDLCEKAKTEINLHKEQYKNNSYALKILEYKDKDVKKEIISEISRILNENIIVANKSSLVYDKLSAEISLNEAMASDNLYDGLPDNGKTNGISRIVKSKSDKIKTLGLTGSNVKELETSSVIELKVDDICYGYLYIDKSSANPLFGMDGRKTQLSPTVGDIPDSATKGNSYLNLLNNITNSQNRTQVISDLFVENIVKKLNKPFLNKNQEFKNFIYALVKDKYILDKKISVVYLLPDEVVTFETDSVFKKVLFYAKLYINVLVNDYLIKMGRSHDVRVYYLDGGPDGQYEQVIMDTLQSIKTKEYLMDDTDDLNTCISLHPGRFEDMYIPMIGGERPIDIETIQGMNADEDENFRENLLSSIISGMGVPRTIIDAVNENDFARTLSAQNGNFIRQIVQRQGDLSPSATKLMRILYRNEFDTKSGNKKDNIYPDKIFAAFSSPASLNLTNTRDELAAAQEYAQLISTIKLPENTDPLFVQKFQFKVIEDMISKVDWKKIDTFIDEVTIEEAEAKAKANVKEKENEENAGNQNLFGNGY